MKPVINLIFVFLELSCRLYVEPSYSQEGKYLVGYEGYEVLLQEVLCRIDTAQVA